MKAIVLEMADIGLQVIHTPGHSPGSVSLYWPSEKALFTGDTVFKDGGDEPIFRQEMFWH
jgi:glyoxylase-like metal-dependent hydrolase (beta-lactamase superfamily II)